MWTLELLNLFLWVLCNFEYFPQMNRFSNTQPNIAGIICKLTILSFLSSSLSISSLPSSSVVSFVISFIQTFRCCDLLYGLGPLSIQSLDNWSLNSVFCMSHKDCSHDSPMYCTCFLLSSISG